jgi:hypothetical protein
LPVFGKLGLMFPPKKPSSHRITRITMIVHNIRFLLLSDLLYNSAYGKSSPATSIDRGVFFSATWGRLLKRDDCNAQRKCDCIDSPIKDALSFAFSVSWISFQ